MLLPVARDGRQVCLIRESNPGIKHLSADCCEKPELDPETSSG
jgi:hypothetical protein